MNDETELEQLLSHMPLDELPRPEHQSELRRKVLLEYDQASDTRLVVRIGRGLIQKGKRVMAHPLSRIAAATTAAALALVWLFAPSMPTASAFAGLLEPMLNAKTARFRVIVKSEGQAVQEGAGYFSAPNHYRQEFEGVVSIADYDRGVIMTLVPKDKKAMVLERKGAEPKESDNYFGNLRDFLRKHRGSSTAQYRDLGEKELDGRRVFGVRIESLMQTATLWGDVETGRLVQLEAVMPGAPTAEVVMSVMQFDVELDAALFDVSPPQGYQVVRMELDSAPAVEKDFIEALRKCLKLTGGEFPAGLDAASIAAMVGKSVASRSIKGGKLPADDETQALLQEWLTIGRGLYFAGSLPISTDAHYAGKGVKASDPKTPVFWYRPDAKGLYRVFYSDLSIQISETAPIVPGAHGVTSRGSIKK